MYLYFYVLLVTCITSLGWGENDMKCKAVGFQCDSERKKIEFCKNINSDPEAIEACEENQVCQQERHNVRCVGRGDADMKFVCTGKGEFPDVKNCSRTYTCPGEGEEPSEVCTCPGETSVYPAPGLFCAPGKCPRESITCTEGAHGHFTLLNKQTTSYYYYCLNSDTVLVYDNVEVPPPESTQKIILRRGKMENNGKECTPHIRGSRSSTSTDLTTPRTTIPSSSPSTIESTSPPSDSPTTPTTVASPVPTNRPSVPGEKPKCNTSGELYETECDCDYFKCDSNLKPVRHTCFEGLKYHSKMKMCVFGECKESECVFRDPPPPSLTSTNTSPSTSASTTPTTVTSTVSTTPTTTSFPSNSPTTPTTVTSTVSTTPTTTSFPSDSPTTPTTVTSTVSTTPTTTSFPSDSPTTPTTVTSTVSTTPTTTSFPSNSPTTPTTVTSTVSTTPTTTSFPSDSPTTPTTVASTVSTTPTTTSFPSDSPTTPTTVASTVSTTRPSVPGEKPKCNTSGELYETECDCDYFKCDSNLKPVRHTCFEGLKYHSKMKMCVFGECKESECVFRDK